MSKRSLEGVQSPESPTIDRAARAASRIITPPPGGDDTGTLGSPFQTPTCSHTSSSESPNVPSLGDLELQGAVAYAKTDNREAPWYGAWIIALKNKLDGVKYNGGGYTLALTFPQHPLVRYLDTEGASDDVRETDEQQQTLFDDMCLSTPLDRPHDPIGNSPDELDHLGATSPSVVFPGQHHSVREREFQTPPRKIVVQSPRHSGGTTTTDSLNIGKEDSRPLERTPDAGPTVQRAPKDAGERTTRVPDFLQILMFFDKGGDSGPPTLVRKRVVLIVESKPARDYLGTILRQTNRQVREQAQHAFAEEPSLLVLGCIITIGDRWKYEEIKRTAFNWEQLKDPNYEETPSSSKHSSSQLSSPSDATVLFDELEAIFRNGGWLDVLDPDTDKVFDKVRRRLREINQDLWQ